MFDVRCTMLCVDRTKNSIVHRTSNIVQHKFL